MGADWMRWCTTAMLALTVVSLPYLPAPNEMSARDLVALIHLAGFATGIGLYGMLALMPRRSARRGETTSVGGIAITAALLGLVWNAGALVVYGWQDFDLGQISPWFIAVSYSALG